MNVPVTIAFRNIAKSEAIEKIIREKAQKLYKFCNRVSSCRVSVEKQQKHQSHGNPFYVRLDVTVPPGHEIVIKRKPSHGQLHYPLTSVIKNAFNAAYREVKELRERQLKDVKKHPGQAMNAVIGKLKKDQGYGFLRTTDDREVYFNKNSVVNQDFDDLKEHDGVHYTEEIGEKGAQASTVHVVSRR
jgi:cold shock CspA family protein/ribosome-associated translation inhibitor RaiA